MQVKKIIYSFLVAFGLVLPYVSHGATFQFVQSLYGSGYRSLVTISSTTVNITQGSNKHLYKVTSAKSSAVLDGFITANSFPTLPLQASTLDANSAYILTADNSSANTLGVYQAHTGQIAGADNSSSAYPDSSAGFYGFVYFQTDENKKIKCYDTTINVNLSPYYPLFTNCQNYLFQNVTSNVSTTTQYVIDTGAIEEKISSTSQAVSDGFQNVAYLMSFTLFVMGLAVSYNIAKK